MGNLTEAKGDDRVKEAWEIARNAGCIGEVRHVQDRWGGYYQCATEYGPYNFSLPARS